jgi:recombinational DNA repair ATPase RecF
LIQETSTLDGARKQELLETLRQYVQTITTATVPKAAGEP